MSRLQRAIARCPDTRTLAAPGEPKVPGVSLTGDRAWTHGGGLYGQMEVITMALIAMLIAAGVVVVIYLGLFVVVFGGLIVILRLDGGGNRTPARSALRRRHRRRTSAAT